MTVQRPGLTPRPYRSAPVVHLPPLALWPAYDPDCAGPDRWPFVAALARWCVTVAAGLTVGVVAGGAAASRGDASDCPRFGPPPRGYRGSSSGFVMRPITEGAR